MADIPDVNAINGNNVAVNYPKNMMNYLYINIIKKFI